MQKVCQSCGSVLDDYVYVFRPYRAQELIDEIKLMFPEVNFTMNVIEGNKVKIRLEKILTVEQKQTMDDYFGFRGYIEDENAENEEVYG